MANILTTTRISSSVKTMLAINDTSGNLSTTYKITIDPIDVEAYDRATIQIRNTNSIVYTAQVFGTLFGAPTAPATAAAAGSHWCQIGDDISIPVTSGVLKSISTTGLRQLTVRILSVSGTPALGDGNCLVFLQGTI
tara:strand:+ start:165 stop:575 length:411 start_codon:yes stop_codon:yes gene_type:complete